jgi:hypothetical protein
MEIYILYLRFIFFGSKVVLDISSGLNWVGGGDEGRHIKSPLNFNKLQVKYYNSKEERSCFHLQIFTKIK